MTARRSEHTPAAVQNLARRFYGLRRLRFHDVRGGLFIIELGQISGKGLFAAIRDHYPKMGSLLTLLGVLIDNTFEADAAKALQPLVGDAAGILLAIGIIAVGFLAVPIMTTGAAYDLCQSFGWKDGLHRRPSEAKLFYAAIVACTLVAWA